MATNVIMPSLGFDMTAGKLARWLKKQGEEVKKGEAIAEVETEKATVEIEAFGSGVLQEILVHDGETVPVNTVIGVIAEPGEKVQVPTAAQAPVGHSADESLQPLAQAGTKEPPEDGRIKASPIAKRIAESSGIDLRLVKGSGPGGRIMEKDVQAAIAEKQATPVVVTPRPSGALPSEAPVSAPVAGERIALSRMRQTIAQRMTQSKTSIPHFYVTVEINMAEALKMREQLNNLASEADKVSVNDLVLAAAARTLTKHPTFNASYRGDTLQLHANINIGVAIAVEDGLLTLALHDADKKSLKQIAGETKGLGERARTNRLRSDDLGQSTFTVSNLGMFGVDEFSAIINPPEAAILAVGAATKRTLVVDDEIKIAPIMKATLAVDHRVADGAQAARFLQDLKKLLENPVNLLVI
jgi:pyruvate dehydrogenase E2 component (dihydrolipoyllysine-residue acetyltransferase)